MTIYASALLTLVVALLSYNYYDHRPSTGLDECPHEAFLRKHVCDWCVDENDALDFSRGRRGVDSTNVNSVVVGGSSEFAREGADGRCVNLEPLRVMNCVMDIRRCRLQGERCTTYHDTGNGHMYYRDTNCTTRSKYYAGILFKKQTSNGLFKFNQL